MNDKYYKERDRLIAWVKTLKVGDKVAVSYTGGGGRVWQIGTIKHATKVFIDVEYYGKFRRKDASCIGYGSYVLTILTPELEAEIRERTFRHGALRRLEHHSRDVWQALTNEQLRRVIVVLDEIESEDANA